MGKYHYLTKLTSKNEGLQCELHPNIRNTLLDLFVY